MSDHKGPVRRRGRDFTIFKRTTQGLGRGRTKRPVASSGGFGFRKRRPEIISKLKGKQK